MGLPGQPLPGSPGSGHGPFGARAFNGALIGCGAMVIIGALMVLSGGKAVASVGTSFIVLGALGLLVGGAGLLTERYLQRRAGPGPEVYRHNGHAPRPPDISRTRKFFRERP